MDFQPQKAIYLQIADWLCDQILAGTHPEGDKLPSVRDCASELEVNVNTVARTFEWLQAHDIVSVRRGMGNYVAEGARRKIAAMKRQEFFSLHLPRLFASMRSLGITLSDLEQEYHKL